MAPATLTRDWEVPFARHLGLDLSVIVAGSFEDMGTYAERDDGTAMTRIGWVEMHGPHQTRVTAEIPTSELAALRPRGKSPQRYLQDAPSGPVQRPRIPDATWIPALERAQTEGRPIGHVLTELLDEWLAGRVQLGGQP